MFEPQSLDFQWSPGSCKNIGTAVSKHGNNIYEMEDYGEVFYNSDDIYNDVENTGIGISAIQ